MNKKPVGNCPSCGTQLVRVWHEITADGAKGRYQCMSLQCPDKRWFNRSGEPRFGAK